MEDQYHGEVEIKATLQGNKLIDLAKQNNGTLDKEYGLKFGNIWISYIGNIMGHWKQELYCEHLGTYT
jgi:hypothetical protein